MDGRLREAFRRFRQADQALRDEGREPDSFHLSYIGGGEREISHPRWDRSWAVPSEHTIDDLGEMGLLRVDPPFNKSRQFSLSMLGRESDELLANDAIPVLDEVGGTAGGSLPAAGRDPKKVAVMHGRDEAARQAVFDLLRRMALEPLEWDALVDRSGSAAPYNGEAVSAAFEIAQAVVVLFTPDDIGCLHPSLLGQNERDDDSDLTCQPRLNVVLEAGMALQSHSRETILIELGRMRQISDLAGRNTIRLDGGAASTNAFANRLESAGCSVDRRGRDWLDGAAIAQLAAFGRTAADMAGTAPVDELQQARREARHLIAELLTIDRTVVSALQEDAWWDVQVTGLPAIQWPAARDLIADNAASVYDSTFPAYVEADQMNKAANRAARVGHSSLDAASRQALEGLRDLVRAAEAALRDFARG